jgi:hypothetical protein
LEQPTKSALRNVKFPDHGKRTYSITLSSYGHGGRLYRPPSAPKKYQSPTIKLTTIIASTTMTVSLTRSIGIGCPIAYARVVLGTLPERRLGFVEARATRLQCCK